METSRSKSLYCLSDHWQASPLLTEILSVWTVVFKPPVIVAEWLLGNNCLFGVWAVARVTLALVATTSSLQVDTDCHQLTLGDTGPPDLANRVVVML